MVSILPTLLHPKSRGFVRLKSSDPKDFPIINPKYLTHPYDIQILVKGTGSIIFIIIKNTEHVLLYKSLFI